MYWFSCVFSVAVFLDWYGLTWFSHGSLMVLSWFSLMVLSWFSHVVLSWFSFAICFMWFCCSLSHMVFSWFVSLLHMFHSLSLYIYIYLFSMVLFRKPLGETWRENWEETIEPFCERETLGEKLEKPCERKTL